MVKYPSVAFVGWNPFQFLHIKQLAQNLPGACLVIEKRKDFISSFNDNILDYENIPILIWEQSRMPLLDGIFDIIVCQTPFFRIEEFKKTKIAMIQYGYAKEPHNYGPWRALADVCMTYGPYATDKISPFTTAISTGNPRYDLWHEDAFHLKAKIKHSSRIDPSKKTILYLPTWGELSSVDEYLESIYDLTAKYNVIIKMHHNTELLEYSRKEKLSNYPVIHYGANDDLLELLSVSDIAISDYSGAIFDAIYCQKPVILLNSNIKDEMGGDKIDEFSLELHSREEIGLTVNNPNELSSILEKINISYESVVDMQNEIRGKLFNETTNATNNAVQTINALWRDEFKHAQHQIYIRKEVIENRKNKRKLIIAEKKLKEIKK